MGYSRLILNLLTATAVTSSVGVVVTALEAHPPGRDPDLSFSLEDTRGDQAKFVFPGPNNSNEFLGTQFLIDQVVWDDDTVETIGKMQGICTQIAVEPYPTFHCSQILDLGNNDLISIVGTFTVDGDTGAGTVLAITGGVGQYDGVTGWMATLGLPEDGITKMRAYFTNNGSDSSDSDSDSDN